MRRGKVRHIPDRVLALFVGRAGGMADRTEY
jgi:hypothetical protein